LSESFFWGIISGNIGATKYCDAAGNNCKAITEMSNGTVSVVNEGRIPANGSFGSSGPKNLGVHDFCFFTDLTYSSDAGQCRLYKSGSNWYIQSYLGARCGAYCADI